MGDDSAGHHGLPGARRGDEHTSVVTDQVIDGRSLLRSQRAGEGQIDRRWVSAIVRELEPAVQAGDELGHSFGEAAGKVKPLEVFAVAGDESGGIPRREAHPLLLVELGVGDRR